MEDTSRVNEFLGRTADVTNSSNESNVTPTPFPSPQELQRSDNSFISMLTRSSPLNYTHSDSYFNENSSSSSSSSLSQPICQLNAAAYDSSYGLFSDIESNGTESDPIPEGLNTMYSLTGTNNNSSASGGSASGFELSDNHPMNAGSSSSGNDGTATTTVRPRVILIEQQEPVSPAETTSTRSSDEIHEMEVDEFLAYLANYTRDAPQNSDEDENDGYGFGGPGVNLEGVEWIQHLPIILEEHIDLMGEGLTEEQIVGNMRTEIYRPANNDTMEPGCCICWDEYDSAQTLGVLDCGGEHHFHDDCIKNWLMIRNSCPLCRRAGLII